MATRSGKTLLTPQDWICAALDALAEGGLAMVAVDRLATRLGATRGSFYWHFRGRAELIEAALAQWERQDTTELIPPFDAIDDPGERLRAVFRAVYDRPVDRIELALASAADDPLVAPTFARVTRTRLDFLRRIFADLGLEGDEAADRAWLAYAFYIGHHELRRNPETRAARSGRLDGIVDLLTSRPPESSPAAEAPRDGA